MTNLLFFQLGLGFDNIVWFIQHADWQRGLIEASIPLCNVSIFVLEIYAFIMLIYFALVLFCKFRYGVKK